MANVRGHKAIDLGPFKGVYNRNDPDNTPLDHFEDAENLNAVGKSWETRAGVGISQSVGLPLENIARIYNFPTQTANTIIALVINDDGDGEIYHVVDPTTVFGPLLTITGMTDFAFIPYAGRGYISPFGTFQTGDIFIQKGLEDEFLYVYMGDGTAARKAAGAGPTNTPLTIANGAAGHTDAGLHIFATVYEYNSGYLSPPSQFTQFTTNPNLSVSFSGIQTTGDTNVVTVHIVATKVISSFNGNLEGYQFFFVPDASVPNGTLVKNNVSFFDLDLLEDASHLIDNYTEIPAGANLSLFHDRLVLGTTFDDISILLISAAGEPEAINQITGLQIMPLDGNPICWTQELRDILYAGKRSKTGSWADTGEEPSDWLYSDIDTGLGGPVHGVATVLDSGGANVDFLFVATFAGIMVFNGKYYIPELSYKISFPWESFDRNEFNRIQMVNIPTFKKLYVVTPDYRIWVGDYSEGMDYKKIKWMPLRLNVRVNCIAVVNIDTVIIGSPIFVD
jgi:hypothetical protein